MTHTLHRRGSEESLSRDYVLLCMAAKDINEDGSEEKMREFLRINLRHDPVNIGDMRTGNMFNASVDEILEKVTSTSIVHGVFSDKDTVVRVLQDLAEQPHLLVAANAQDVLRHAGASYTAQSFGATHARRRPTLAARPAPPERSRRRRRNRRCAPTRQLRERPQ